MHELALAEIQADVRHLAFDIEKQQVADTQLVSADRNARRPELFRRSRHFLSGARIGVLHQAAAIEASGTTAAVPIRHANLV